MTQALYWLYWVYAFLLVVGLLTLGAMAQEYFTWKKRDEE